MQDLAVAALEGKLTGKDIRREVTKLVGQHFQCRHWKDDISLDMTIPGTDLRLGDTLRAPPDRHEQ